MEQTRVRPSQLPSAFIFHEDPGHGWLEVPYQALHLLGIAKEITGSSYRSGDTCYLEEDLDAVPLIKAWLAVHGRKGDLGYFLMHRTDRYRENTFVRELPGYEPNA